MGQFLCRRLCEKAIYLLFSNEKAGTETISTDEEL